ncbi:MAG: chloride channel protein [Bacteroidia bacterium]
MVGLSAGLAAIILKLTVHSIQQLMTKDWGIEHQYFLYLLGPMFGIFLTVLFVKKHLKGKLGRGNSNILYAIAKKNSYLPADQMYSHVVTSALTVGFGGSAGLESPIVTTGSAIGSNYSKTYRLTYKDRTLLLACGAAAGIGAAFNAPVAGLLFAMEVLLADVTISAFIPLMIAAATGALCSKIILGDDVLLSFRLLSPFNYHNIPWYVVLGLLAGFVSVYYARAFPVIERIFSAGKKSPYRSVIIGGVLLSLLIFLFPSLYGEGYNSIRQLADVHPEKLLEHSYFEGKLVSPISILIFVSVITLIKVLATAATIGSGGNGGNFAPSLFVGSYLGFVFSWGLTITGISELPVTNFTLVGMAGILTGIFHAPLTGIFLIAELTGGYELMIPLMIVSALSYTVVKYFEPYSMDTKKMAKKGHIFTHDKDRNILSSLKVRKIIETEFQPVLPKMTLGELVDLIASSQRNIFPVINEDLELLGVVKLERIREIMFKTELYSSVTVEELMQPVSAVVHPDEDMYSVMKKFDETGSWNLPIVENNQYIGFISKSSIFSKYRSQLMRNTVEG